MNISIFSAFRLIRYIQVATCITLASVLGNTTVAIADDSPIKPDFCFVVNPGTANAEITFFPSKLNIVNGAGSDRAAFYRISSTDGVFSRDVQPNEKKNLKDTGSAGTSRSYQVQTIGDHGRVSNLQPCLSFDAVSSISPGKLKDWRRSAVVEHGLGDQPLNTSTRRFSGADHDIVTTKVNPAESSNLNPDGELFAYQARVTLTSADLNTLATSTKPSWNVMQRGFSDSPGGLWKMSLVMSGNPKVPRAQCVARDDQLAGPSRGKLMANSTYVLEAGVPATITCVVDDAANKIRIIVNGRTDDFAPDAGEPGFGNVNPSSTGSNCAQVVAQSISVGNKPACPTIAGDDRFQGTINLARILKGS